MSINWRNINYLKTGNSRQKKSFKLLSELNILKTLEKFDPILVGTIPIAIDIETSDLDIICEVYDFEEFEQYVDYNYSKYENYKKYNADFQSNIFLFLKFNATFLDGFKYFFSLKANNSF